MKPAKNLRASMSLSVVTMVAAIATAAAGCGGSTPTGMNVGTIDSAAELADLMDAAALPMASVFTLINGGTATSSAGAAARSSLAALTSPLFPARRGERLVQHHRDPAGDIHQL